MINQYKDVKVRIGPSPTGDPHVGTGYVALINYAFAKKYNGKFVFRIEDTNQKNIVHNSIYNIIKSLIWLGLTWDDGVNINSKLYQQSNRIHIYQKYAHYLIKLNKAYWCSCSYNRLAKLKLKQQKSNQPSKYDGYCRYRSHIDVYNEISNGALGVIRLKVPNIGKTIFYDILRGPISIYNNKLDDQILLKNDGFPTYHLANVIDDHLMNITHVIRGEEWISSTPKHVLLYKFLNFKIPYFCHLPLLRNHDRSKVSKSINPTSIFYYKHLGILPEVMVNFLGLMAFSFIDNKQIFNLKYFVNNFSLKKIALGGPIFDIKKLLWLNKQYIHNIYTNKQITKYLLNNILSQSYLNQIIPLVKYRMHTIEDFINYTNYFFVDNLNINYKLCLINNNLNDTINILNQILETMQTWSEFNMYNIKYCFNSCCQIYKLSKKTLFMTMRLILTGTTTTPPLFPVILILGKYRCCYRIEVALKYINNL